MANREETYSPAFNTVFVKTSIDTRLAILAHIHDTIFDFREMLFKEHKQCYPEVGEINISSLKVLREGDYYRLPDCMNMNKVFVGLSTEKWFLYVDVERVENGELMAIMPADRNPELLDKNEVAIDSVLVDGHTKALTIEEGLENKAVEKKTKKRKIESSDGKKSRKKSKINLSQSAVATTPSRDVADESLELSGNVQVEVAMTESLAVSPRTKSDDIQDIASGEKNVISMGENQHTSDADMLRQEKSMTNNSERLDEHTRDEMNDAQANQIPKEALETDESQKSRGEVPSEKLDDLTGAMEQDLGEGEKTAGLDNIDQEKELAPTSRDDLTESHEACAEVQVGVTPEHCDTLPREKLDDVLPEATEKDIGRDEGSSLALGAAENMEASSGMATGPATEKKRKRKKSSKDDINQSTAAASTTSRKTVDEINGVPENEMVGKSVEDVGRDNVETDNLESYPASQLEVNSGLPTGPVSEKKRKRKKSSKDDIIQSTAATTTTSREIVNEINEATGNLDRVDATSESLAVSERGNLGNPLAKAIQKAYVENEMAEKIDDDAENQLGSSNGLISGTATEKKKKRKKSSKDHINQSTAAATTISREVLNEREKVSDHVDTTSEVIPNSRSEKLVNALEETIQNENEMGSKVVDKVGSIEATPNGADELQAKNNIQVADLATTLPALVEESKRTLKHEVAKDNGELDAAEAKSVKSTKKKKPRKSKTLNGADEIQAEDNVQVAALVEESKTLDNIGKFTDDKRTLVDEVAKDNGDEAKSVKPTKKKKSRKTKTPAMEDTLVDSGPQNVEPFKAVDGECPDNVIRNVLDSLHQRNEIQESLDIVEKKASKRSKKRLSLNILDSQVLSVEVNNAAQESVPLINNPEDTDASWSSVKKNTTSNASCLKDRIEFAENHNDPFLSQQTQKEKADMGDNFGSRQKDSILVGGKNQDKVTGEAKSKKEKKSLDLRSCGSIDGSLSSMKPKERNIRAQPACSGTSQMMSRLKNDRTGSKVDDSITSVKKSSNSLTVNKNKLNFFKDAEEWNSSDDESKRTPPPHVSTKPSPDNSSTKSPPDSSSDDDSDVTSMSRKQGNNLPGGTFKFSGSLQDILRSSRSYKKAKETASQYMSDDESPALDIVPESQA